MNGFGRAEIIKTLGEPSKCRRCMEEIWWDHKLWRSINNAGTCRRGNLIDDPYVPHRPYIPDLSNLDAVQRWVDDIPQRWPIVT